MKGILHSTISTLLLTFAFAIAAAPLAWADDSDDDDLGVGSFDVMDDSDSEEGSLLALQELPVPGI